MTGRERKSTESEFCDPLNARLRVWKGGCASMTECSMTDGSMTDDSMTLSSMTEGCMTES